MLLVFCFASEGLQVSGGGHDAETGVVAGGERQVADLLGGATERLVLEGQHDRYLHEDCGHQAEAVEAR